MEGERKPTRKAKTDANNRTRGKSSTRGNSRQKRPTTSEINRVSRAAFKDLTPDRLRTLWRLNNPDRPEVRSMLERLYRLKY
jgi:hypothetical protein